jgi:hypothetical protein
VKRISLLTIAALAALALTAAIGSATASATVLCKTNVSPCPSSDVLPAGNYITYGANEELNALTLKSTSTATVYQCGYVGLSERTTAERSVSLPAIGERLLGSCNLGAGSGSSCSVSMSKSEDKLLYAAGGRAIVSGPLTITADCHLGTVCVFSGSFQTSNIDPVENTATFSGKFNRVSGSAILCGGNEFTMNTLPLYHATGTYYISS